MSSGRARVSLARIRRGVTVSRRGQALTEVALIAPVLLLLLGGVGDLGRAFYYKISVENVARESAHWATLPFGTNPPNSPPSDNEIYNKVASPSQESFGVGLHLAPDCIRNATPPLNTQASANPACAGTSLTKGNSWLFIYPHAGSGGRTAALPPGAHWSVVASRSDIVQAPPPDHGGVAAVLNKVAGSLAPIDAYASACYTWSSVSAAPTSVTMASGSPPYSQAGLVVSLNGVAGSGQATNTADMTIAAPAGVALSQTWSTPSGASTGSIDPHSTTSDSVNLSVTQALAPGTYTFTVSVTSSGGGCPQPTEITTFTWIIPASPSPSPSPSLSPVPTPSPSGSAPPSPPPVVGGNPNGAQITCTVIYYFAPVTPLLFGAGAIYIVGTATLQAVY